MAFRRSGVRFPLAPPFKRVGYCQFLTDTLFFLKNLYLPILFLPVHDRLCDKKWVQKWVQYFELLISLFNRQVSTIIFYLYNSWFRNDI